jgi:hypothetical protein
MNTFHSTQWPWMIHATIWYCDVGHELEPFNIHNEFINHMKSVEHSGRPPPTDLQLQSLSQRLQQSVPRDEFTCPLCNGIPDYLKPIISEVMDREKAFQELQKHIAKHLRFLALKFIPDLNTGQQNSSEISDIQDASQKRLREDDSKASLPSGIDMVRYLPTIQLWQMSLMSLYMIFILTDTDNILGTKSPVGFR